MKPIDCEERAMDGSITNNGLSDISEVLRLAKALEDECRKLLELAGDLAIRTRNFEDRIAAQPLQPARSCVIETDEQRESYTYNIPPVSMLSSDPASLPSLASADELESMAHRLQETLKSFGLKSRVVGWTPGPLITTFKVELNGGERKARICNLEDDIALAMAVESVRIYAPIPGTSLVGIEIPNRKRQVVYLGDVLHYAEDGALELAIGKDTEGKPVAENLATMPHLLIAGAPESGKSTLINSVITSFAMRCTPEKLRLILIDPTNTLHSAFNDLPHLYMPTITNARDVENVLARVAEEMEQRLMLLKRMGARDIDAYNEKVRLTRNAGEGDAPGPIPYLAIVVSELSNLMMLPGKDVENSIVNLTQVAHTVGIHLIMATEQPTANVITGAVKSGFKTRIALTLDSALDSRVILDEKGAERLLGRGDMLLRRNGHTICRAIGAYISDEEIAAVIDWIKEHCAADLHEDDVTVANTENGSSSTPEN